MKAKWLKGFMLLLIILPNIIGNSCVYGQSAEVYYRKGLHYLSKELYDSAIVSFTKAIELDSNFLDAYLKNILAKRYKSSDDETAVSELEELIARHPTYADAYFELANTYESNALQANLMMAKENYESAILIYDKYLDIVPNSIIAFEKRGECKHKIGDIRGAILDLSFVAEKEPNNFELIKSIGKDKMEIGNISGAIVNFTKIIERDSNNSEAYYLRGYAYLKLNKLDQAYADESRAIKLNKQSSKAYNIRGMVMGDKKDYQAAMADMNMAIKIAKATNEDQFTYYINKGIISDENNYYKDAIADFSYVISELEGFIGTEGIRFDEYNMARLYYVNSALEHRGRTKIKIKEYSGACADFLNISEPSEEILGLIRKYSKSKK